MDMVLWSLKMNVMQKTLYTRKMAANYLESESLLSMLEVYQGEEGIVKNEDLPG